MSQLLRESLGMAVLDTGCSRTVAGEDWIQEYEDTLTDEESPFYQDHHLGDVGSTHVMYGHRYHRY